MNQEALTKQLRRCSFSVALVSPLQPHIWFCNLRLLLAPAYDFEDDINMMMIMTMMMMMMMMIIMKV